MPPKPLTDEQRFVRSAAYRLMTEPSVSDAIEAFARTYSFLTSDEVQSYMEKGRKAWFEAIARGKESMLVEHGLKESGGSMFDSDGFADVLFKGLDSSGNQAWRTGRVDYKRGETLEDVVNRAKEHIGSMSGSDEISDMTFDSIEVMVDSIDDTGFEQEQSRRQMRRHHEE